MSLKLKCDYDQSVPETEEAAIAVIGPPHNYQGFPPPEEEAEGEDSEATSSAEQEASSLSVIAAGGPREHMALPRSAALQAKMDLENNNFEQVRLNTVLKYLQHMFYLPTLTAPHRRALPLNTAVGTAQKAGEPRV